MRGGRVCGFTALPCRRPHPWDNSQYYVCRAYCTCPINILFWNGPKQSEPYQYFTIYCNNKKCYFWTHPWRRICSMKTCSAVWVPTSSFEVPLVVIVCVVLVVSVVVLQVCSIYHAVCRLGRIMSCPCEYASGQLGYYAPLHYHYATAPPYYAAKRHFSTSHKTKTGER